MHISSVTAGRLRIHRSRDEEDGLLRSLSVGRLGSTVATWLGPRGHSRPAEQEHVTLLSISRPWAFDSGFPEKLFPLVLPSLCQLPSPCFPSFFPRLTCLHAGQGGAWSPGGADSWRAGRKHTGDGHCGAATGSIPAACRPSHGRPLVPEVTSGREL